MAMPPNSTGENSRWWSDFVLQHGVCSEQETGFLGYLSTRGLHPYALSTAQLDQAYSDFEAFVAASAPPPEERR